MPSNNITPLKIGNIWTPSQDVRSPMSDTNFQRFLDDEISEFATRSEPANSPKSSQKSYQKKNP